MANSIKISTYNVDDIKIGTSSVTAVYVGTNLVWSGGTPTPPTPTTTAFEVYDINGDVLTSGTCESLSNGTLTINEVTNNFSVTYDLMYSAVVSDCVTTIDTYAFNGIGMFGTPSFTSITIGSGVTSIGDYGLAICPNMASITINATTPPTLGSNVFYETNNCPIYVPAESVSAYQSAWSEYASRIQAIPTPTKDYLRTIARDSGTISLVIGTSVSTSSLTSISYSLDSGSTWVTSANTDGASVTLETPTLANGDVVYWKGDGVQLATNTNGGTYTSFSSSTNYDVEGNVMSLLAGDNFENAELASGYTYHLANLFRANTKVINASGMTIPSMKMYGNDCNNMFTGCTSLVTAPSIINPTAYENGQNGFFKRMFASCTSLTVPPQLPSLVLGEQCYSDMFNGCTSLPTAPQLPATTLAVRCYQYMFRNCTSLTTAPSLPATTLATYCYNSMFYGCTSLTTAPSLLATTLTNNCYQYMFNGCSSLNSITCLATDISAIACTSSWLYRVAANGTFTKNPNMSSWSRGNSGIPNGWTVEDYSS